MEITKQKQKVLKSYFSDKDFVEALMDFIDETKAPCMVVLTSPPTKEAEEETMNMILARGGCIALARLTENIRMLVEASK